MSTIIQVLMDRDGLSWSEAGELLHEARGAVAAGADPEEILFEEFGLEPDYLFELL